MTVLSIAAGALGVLAAAQSRVFVGYKEDEFVDAKILVSLWTISSG